MAPPIRLSSLQRGVGLNHPLPPVRAGGLTKVNYSCMVGGVGYGSTNKGDLVGCVHVGYAPMS
jgi:hypothetical protein